MTRAKAAQAAPPRPTGALQARPIRDSEVAHARDWNSGEIRRRDGAGNDGECSPCADGTSSHASGVSSRATAYPITAAAPPKPRPTTAADINAALRLRFPPQSHALMFEVAPTTGGGTRYADAIAIGLWQSHGYLIQGIEVKVSRADFLHEMKQPEKSAPIMRYCGRWWLACPKGMVKPVELPPTWGMLELHSDGTLQVKVKAPILKADPVTLGFFASLCRRRAGVDEEMAKVEIEKAVASRVAEIKRGVDNDRHHELCARLRDAEEAERRYLAIKEATGVDLAKYGSEKELIAAIRVVQQAQGKWHDNLANVRATLSRAVQALDEAGFDPVTQK